MATIYCDYDSFLNDLNFAWIAWIEERFGRKVTLPQIFCWDWLRKEFGPEADEFWQTPGNYRLVSPLPGAQSFVKDLQRKYGRRNVKVLTCSPECMKDEKDRHIREHFDIAPGDIIHASVKWPHTKDGVLLDDNKSHVLAHTANNGRLGVLFDHGGNYGWTKLDPEDNAHPDLVKVARSYDEIKQILRGR